MLMPFDARALLAVATLLAVQLLAVTSAAALRHEGATTGGVCPVGGAGGRAELAFSPSSEK